MNNNEEELLALLIIKNKNFSDSYQLCKILSWKFGIINCNEIITRISKSGAVNVSYPVSETLKHFNLTSVGNQLLEEQIEFLVELLKKEHPQQATFIDNLLATASRR